MVSDKTFDISPIQEAVKWLLTTFAAVGAVIIGGVQFSDIGDLSGCTFFLAIAGVAIGLIGVGIAIWHTSSVLVTRIVSVSSFAIDPDAADFFNHHRDICGYRYNSFEKFIEERQSTWEKWNAKRPDGVSDVDWKNQRKNLSSKLEVLENTATRVAQAWRFEKVCRAFQKARSWMFVGAALAVLGTLLITYAAGFKEDDLSDQKPTAVMVEFHLGPVGYRRLLDQLGKECIARHGKGVILDGWPSGSDFLVLTDREGCTPVRIRWNNELGLLNVMSEKGKN